MVKSSYLKEEFSNRFFSDLEEICDEENIDLKPDTKTKISSFIDQFFEAKEFQLEFRAEEKIKGYEVDFKTFTDRWVPVLSTSLAGEVVENVKRERRRGKVRPGDFLVALSFLRDLCPLPFCIFLARRWR